VTTRRKFLNTVVVGGTGLAVASSAKSYARIAGANERVNFAVIGLNSRGYAHLSSIQANKAAARITHVCDVESNILRKFADETQKGMGEAPATEKDFRKVLELKEVDAISIAAPDHWHTAMGIAGMQAGKHVYVEKPLSHNPAEGVMLVEAQKKTGKLAQMGNQQRSSKYTIEVIQKIHEGMIGRAYYAKAWYSNSRKSIGVGKEAAVPATLDWDLFQGPAPRRPYKDNVQPYNWHWFKIWGTGEALNNGTHEVDVCRWALGEEFPKRVTSAGGRYQFKDDWEFYDTLITNFEYEDKLLSWEGKSCQGMKIYGRDRGSAIMGTTGTVVIDRDGYEVFDWAGKKTSEYKVPKEPTSSADLVGRDSMTDAHFANFIAAIRTGEKLHSPVAEGNISVTMLQLSNIAYDVKRELRVDPKDGKILDDSEAMKGWNREYEKGWAPKV